MKFTSGRYFIHLLCTLTVFSCAKKEVRCFSDQQPSKAYIRAKEEKKSIVKEEMKTTPVQTSDIVLGGQPKVYARNTEGSTKTEIIVVKKELLSREERAVIRKEVRRQRKMCRK